MFRILFLLHHDHQVFVVHLVMFLANQTCHAILIRPSLPSATHLLLLDKEILLQHLVLDLCIVSSSPQNPIRSMKVKYLLHLFPLIHLHQFSLQLQPLTHLLLNLRLPPLLLHLHLFFVFSLGHDDLKYVRVRIPHLVSHTNNVLRGLVTLVSLLPILGRLL